MKILMNDIFTQTGTTIMKYKFYWAKYTEVGC